MGIDYAVELACAAKSKLPVGKLLSTLKLRQQVERVMEIAREEDPAAAPERTSFVRQISRPGSESEQERINCAEALERTGVLEELAEGCAGCHANVLKTDFGCIGHVGYPIEPLSEEWAMSLLPRDPASTAGRLLRSALADLGYDGERAARLRREDAGLFVLRSPLSQSWSSGPYSLSVTSDQVFEMMFCLGNLRPSHCLLLCLALGLLPADLPPQDFAKMAGDLALRRQALAKARIPAAETGTQAAELASFLKAAHAAAYLDVPLLVSA